MAERYNTEFREEAAASKYPFDPQATQTAFPTQLFLDASLYLPSGDFEPPFYVKSVEPAEDDKVRVIVADGRGATAGTAICDPAAVTGTAVLYTDYGRSVGVLVFYPDHMGSLRGDLNDGPRSFSTAQTKLASETARFYGPKGVLNVTVDDVSVNNNVRIVFSGGVTYNPVDNTVNLFGEESSLNTALLTLNGIGGEHGLLMPHVYQDYESESALRIETSGAFIKIGKSRDFV